MDWKELIFLQQNAPSSLPSLSLIWQKSCFKIYIMQTACFKLILSDRQLGNHQAWSHLKLTQMSGLYILLHI